MYPVDLEFGPDGHLYYVDVATGSIRRISFTSGNQPPVAVVSASPTSGPAPLIVNFDGSGSSDPDGTITSYAWDLDGDGQFDDSTAQSPARSCTTAATYSVRLRVTDNEGAPSLSSPFVITAGSHPPSAFIDQPAAGFTWRAGDVISFAGHGTDPEDGTLPASALNWNVTLQHCSSQGNCHAHPVQSFTGVSSGSFSAPDHEYPSFLELASPSPIARGSATPRRSTCIRGPFPRTSRWFPPGSTSSLTARRLRRHSRRRWSRAPRTRSARLRPRSSSGTTYVFAGWSDGGAQTHTITASCERDLHGHLHSTDRYRLQRRGPRRLPARLLAPGRGERHLGSGLLGQQPHRHLPEHAHALAARARSRADSNTAVAFNGTDEYVNVPYNAALNPAAFTVEAWANVTGGQGSFRSIVTSRDYAPGNARGFVLYAAPDNTWQFWTGSGDWNIVYGPAVQLNTWTHLAATYDGTTARMYVNGSSLPRRRWAPGERDAPAADRHRQERGRSPVLPARTPGRGGRVRQRALGGAGAGALRGRGLVRRR